MSLPRRAYDKLQGNQCWKEFKSKRIAKQSNYSDKHIIIVMVTKNYIIKLPSFPVIIMQFEWLNKSVQGLKNIFDIVLTANKIMLSQISLEFDVMTAFRLFHADRYFNTRTGYLYTALSDWAIFLAFVIEVKSFFDSNATCNKGLNQIWLFCFLDLHTEFRYKNASSAWNIVRIPSTWYNTKRTSPSQLAN